MTKKDRWLGAQIASAVTSEFHMSPTGILSRRIDIVVRRIEPQWLPGPGPGYITFNWGLAIVGLAEKLFGREEPSPMAYISGRPASAMPSLRSDMWAVVQVGNGFDFDGESPLSTLGDLTRWLQQFVDLDAVHSFLLQRDLDRYPRLISPPSETNRLELLVGIEILLGSNSVRDRIGELEEQYRERGLDTDPWRSSVLRRVRVRA